jgi:heme oxygenase
MRTLEALRDATRDIHQRLHHSPAFAPLMRTPPEAAGYARLLGRLRGFHAPAEAALFTAAETALPELNDLPARRKAHLLTADIAALAPLFPAGEPDREIEPPAAGSRPAILGGLYVIEGATLGGRDLGRALAPVLHANGLQGLEGRRFFLAYDPHQGQMWRRFCAALDQAATGFTPADHALMAEAARAMFLSMEDWLARPRFSAN